MAFTVILICIIVQRWFHLDSYTRKHEWFGQYYAWMQRHFAKVGPWSGVMGALLVMLPAFVTLILAFSIVYHLLGAIGYYVLSLVVVWYCLDARYLSQVRQGPFRAQQLLAMYYQHVFALIFWYLIFGLAGVALYELVSELRELLEERTEPSEVDQGLLVATIRIEGVMDWVPLRLMGLTYAVIGHFGPTFKLWLHEFPTGVAHTREQAAACGATALDMEGAESLSDSALTTIEQFINRALCVWLLVIALFTAGMWFG